MSLYDKASFVLLPHAYAQGKLFAVKPMTGIADATYTRSTTATRFNKLGRLERIPWNLIGLTDAPGNLSKTNCTATVADAMDGDGLITADTFRETTANSVHGYLANLSKDTYSQDYRVDAWVKPDGRNWIMIMIADTTAGVNAVIQYYNIASGVLGSQVLNGSGFTPVLASIEAAGNGYYKCVLVANTGIQTTCGISIVTAVADKISSYVGDVTMGIKWWKYQIYEGASERPFLAVGSLLTNFPVLNYLNSSCPTLELYPGATNQFLNSNNVGATWTGTRCSLVRNGGIGIDGQNSAALLTVTDVSGLVRFSSPATVTPSSSTMCFSIYLKKVATISATTFRICIINNTTGESKECIMNWSTMQYTNSSGGSGTVAINSIYSEEVFDSNGVSTGYYRIVLSVTTQNPGTSWTGYFNVQDGAGGGLVVGESLLLSAAQLETNSRATPYVYTTTAIIARGSESVTLTGLDTKQVLTSDKGTLFFELAPTRDFGNSNNGTLAFGDMQIRGHTQNAGFWSYQAYYNNASNGLGYIGRKIDRIKCAFVFNGTSVKVFSNGVLIGSTNARTPGIPTSLTLNGGFGEIFFKSLLICPDVITDAEAILETSLL